MRMYFYAQRVRVLDERSMKWSARMRTIRDVQPDNERSRVWLSSYVLYVFIRELTVKTWCAPRWPDVLVHKSIAVSLYGVHIIDTMHLHRHSIS